MTYVALPGGSIVPEKDVNELLSREGKSISASSLRGRPAKLVFQGKEFQALIISLKADSLRLFLNHVAVSPDRWIHQVRLFISTGSAMSKSLVPVLSMLRVDVTLLERPGVARITNKGIEQIIDALSSVAA
jgi:hypothetical protein